MRILAAFKAVDGAIAGNGDHPLLSRLAHVQLVRVFRSLSSVIKSERQGGLIQRSPGYGDTSVAIDLYSNAQGKVSRGQLLERKRAARRWAVLAGPSPFLLLIYSDTAEAIVYVWLLRFL